jgi:hypothetical protein
MTAERDPEREGSRCVAVSVCIINLRRLRARQHPWRVTLAGRSLLSYTAFRRLALGALAAYLPHRRSFAARVRRGRGAAMEPRKRSREALREAMRRA